MEWPAFTSVQSNPAAVSGPGVFLDTDLDSHWLLTVPLRLPLVAGGRDGGPVGHCRCAVRRGEGGREGGEDGGEGHHTA